MACRILVVDDSATIQKVIKIAFSRHQVTVLAANTMVEAIAEMRRGAVDILVVDAGLPGVRGAEDFQKLVNEAGSAMFLMLIGSYESIDEQQLQAAGFKHFLRKPFESVDIIAKVTELLGRQLPFRETVAPQPPAGAPGSTHQQPPPPPPPVPPAPKQPSPLDVHDGKVSRFGYDDEPTQPNVTYGGDQAPSPAAPSPHELPPLPVEDSARDDKVAPPPPPSRSTSQWQSTTPGKPVPAPPDRDMPPPPSPLTDETRRGRPAFSLKEVEEGSSFVAPPNVPSAPDRDSIFDDRGELIDDAHRHTFPPERPPVPPHASALDEVRPTINEVRAEIERFIRQELEVAVEKALRDYCAEHFAPLAREVIQAELRRLADEKARHLVDG